MLQEKNIKLWIRHVVVPSLTDGIEHAKNLKNYLKNIKNVEKIELLPYHVMGVTKYQELNIPYSLEGVLPPSSKDMEEFENIIKLKEI